MLNAKKKILTKLSNLNSVLIDYERIEPKSILIRSLRNKLTFLKSKKKANFMK